MISKNLDYCNFYDVIIGFILKHFSHSWGLIACKRSTITTHISSFTEHVVQVWNVMNDMLFCQNQRRKRCRFLTRHLGIPYTESSQYIYSTLHYSIQAVLVCYSEHTLSILPLFITPLLCDFPPLSLSHSEVQMNNSSATHWKDR